MNYIEIGKEIEKLTSQLIEKIAIKYPSKWELYGRKILAGDLSITDDNEIKDLYRQLKNLEDRTDNPYIQLLNMNDKKKI